MVGKLHTMEYLDKIYSGIERKVPITHYGINVGTSNGPADWIQKEIRDSLAVADALLTDTMKKEILDHIKTDEMKVWKKRDILDALAGVSTAATTAAKNLNNAAFSLEARKLCEKRREEMERKEKEAFDYIDTDIAYTKQLQERFKKEKENNMFNNSQFYFDRIKDRLQVTNLTVTESSGYCTTPEIRVEGFVPTDILHSINNTNKKEYDKMYKNAPKMPKPTGIIRRDNTTRVDWDDKTYTIIVLEEGKEDLDMFHTFCIAFTKKMFGSTTNIMKAIEENDTDTIERERAEAIEKANKEAEEETKKLKAKVEKAEFEAAVKREMFDHKVREEAIRRIMLKEGADIRKTEKIIDRFVKE